MTLSLKQRLLGVGALIVLVFVVSTGTVLDIAFTEVAETSRIDRLQSHVYTLLAVAELEDTLLFPDALPESKLSTPGSGLYALVQNSDLDVVWKSPSMLARDFTVDFALAPGELKTVRTYLNPGPKIFVLGYGVSWTTAEGDEISLQIWVGEEDSGVRRQVQAFRRSLWSWLVAVTVLLMVSLTMVLKWSLRPLGRVEQSLAEIEAGRLEAIHGQYPRELRGLIRNLNVLIKNERSRMEHYRNTLANLAHSLKTPLAVLRSTIENDHSTNRKVVSLEQIDQVSSMIEYQLAKASASGRPTFCEAIAIRPVVNRIVAALNKVYAEKSVTVTLECDERIGFPGIEGDLMEIAGNLLENAFKWCRHSVFLRVTTSYGAEAERLLLICVEDDGPGIAEQERELVCQRGVRADQSQPGHGIGLAVVYDLASAYHGQLIIGKSDQQGAAVCVQIPI